MHIAMEGLDGAGKTCTAKCLAKELGYVYYKNPIFELVGQYGVECFLENLSCIEGDLHTNVAALFFGVGNLYLNQLKQEKDIITDRHLCSTYFWNVNGNNMEFFDFLVGACGKPDLTVILYAKAEVRRQRIMIRNSCDLDLLENIYNDEKYEKALEFVKRYNMKYMWLDNTDMNIQQTVIEIKKYVITNCF